MVPLQFKPGSSARAAACPIRPRTTTDSRLSRRLVVSKAAKNNARDTRERRRDDDDDASFSATRPVASLAAALLVSLSSTFLPLAAHASLLELPASRLQNTYWLVRAGESVSESAGRVDTNRATKQGTGAGLSDLGKRQVAEGALPLVAREACGGGCYVYYGTVRRSEQIAAAIGAAAGLSQSRLVPEFSFLDPRGLGAFEGGQIAAVTDEVGAGDASSPLYRPPMGSTGTPNESLSDVLIRVTQLVSAEETKHRGEEVVIVFPDAALPGALQAAVLGEDLRSAESLAPPPGGAARLRLAPSSSPMKGGEEGGG